MQEFMTFIKSRQPVTFLLVLGNVLVFVILSVLGDTENVVFMMQHGACFTPLIQNGEYYRLFTGMFLHFGLEHLLFNMLILVFLGDTLERVVGKFRYLVIYLGGGLAGNILSCLVDLRTEKFAVSAGASGAIFAAVGALVWIVVRNKGNVENLSGQRLVMMAILSIAQGLTSTGIDNSAHIGGFAAGFVLAMLVGAAKCAARRSE